MSEYIRTSVGQTHWKDYGGTGELLVLVHGLGGSLTNWDAVGPRLAEHGRTVALDLPGFGLSPPAGDWELETHVGAIVAFIEELGETATLVGNSMGALLAEMTAANHREMIRELVLLSPATPPRLPDPRLHWPTARRLLIQATPVVGPAYTSHLMERSTPEEIVRKSLELITHKPGRVPLDMVESFVDLARARKKLPWAARAVPKTGNSIARFFLPPSRFVAMIRRIGMPTLVIQGLADHIVSPTSVEWMCSLRPDWELVQMDDTGHTPQIDAPVRLMGIVAPWLESHLKDERAAQLA